MPVERISVCNVIENMAEHSIHFPSHNNDVINVLAQELWRHK